MGRYIEGGGGRNANLTFLEAQKGVTQIFTFYCCGRGRKWPTPPSPPILGTQISSSWIDPVFGLSHTRGQGPARGYAAVKVT